MPRKTTEKTAGRGARAAKGRGEMEMAAAIKKAPREKRGAVAEHENDMRQTEETSTLAYEQIARRAHDIWMQHGCPDGQDKQNWYEAEKQLRRETGSW